MDEEKKVKLEGKTGCNCREAEADVDTTTKVDSFSFGGGGLVGDARVASWENVD